MSLALELNPLETRRLEAAAQDLGLAPETLARDLVVRQLPPLTAEEKDPMVALLDQWREEDAHMTAEEIAEETRQWEEFKKNMNEERDRAGARRLF